MPKGEPANFDPHIRVNPDGSLQNKRHERLATLIAEGFTPNEGWKAVGGGGTPTQGSRRYGRRIFADKTFIERVKVLTDQKTAMEADPIWGEAMWMVAQLWRTAVLMGDIKTMGEAVKMRVQIADKRVDPEAPAEDAPGPTAKGPGRPAADSTQTKGLPPDAIRAKLMQVNRTDPDLDEDSPVDGEA